MIWIKRFFWLMFALLVLLTCATGIYVNRTFAALDGEVKVTGLKAQVSVTRDAADVTHIKAQSPADAWFSIGYVHAQERGWQLEFNRRVMHGELSEAFWGGHAGDRQIAVHSGHDVGSRAPVASAASRGSGGVAGIQ